MQAIHSRAALDATVVRITAPMKAPTAPGRAMTTSTRQSTLPSRQWLIPETKVVPIFAAWVPAEAATAEYPRQGQQGRRRDAEAHAEGPVHHLSRRTRRGRRRGRSGA